MAAQRYVLTLIPVDALEIFLALLAQPCPYCGGTALSITNYWTDDGDYQAITCEACLASAPAQTWNMRTAVEPTQATK